jgi:hypothetical protein
MRPLYLAVIALLWLGCDGSDISEDPPIGTSDAAATIDSAGPTIDGAVGIDAMPASPDADVNRAQDFCDRYDSLCGYDNTNMNRYDDEAACLAAFDGFLPDQRDCVESELDSFETDGMLQHCGRATGNGPCG